MQFQQDWPKDKKITALFFAENLEKFRSTEHYGAPPEGSTIFFVPALWQYRNGKLSIS